jgi:uncharacterized membrane protein YqgA involved in biofilm formation
MGIIADAIAISLGILIGSFTRGRVKFKIDKYFAIAVMIISLLGFIENSFTVSEERILGSDMMIVVFSLIIGSALGDLLRLEDRIGDYGKGEASSKNGVLDALFLFGIGGLQISGPILLAATGDSSQLYLKSMIDFPLAILTGATYGRRAAIAALPVALIQVAVAVVAFILGDFISGGMLMSLCAIGFIILFFTGFNMISPAEGKIKNTNMLPAVIFVIIFHLFKGGVT